MSSSPSPTDNNGTLAKRHSVYGGGVFGGFLSSWMGYFSGRSQYDIDVQHMFAQNQQMMDRMERLMNNLEEKLESLEDRERNNIGEGHVEEGGIGESLTEGEDNDGCDDEDSISISSEDLKMKGEALQAYQDMVATNRTDWAYSAENHMSTDPNLTDHEEYNICRLFNTMEEITTKMRRGEYHYDYEQDIGEPLHFYSLPEYDFQGVRLHSSGDDINRFRAFTPNHITLRPHWEEFVDALDDFDFVLDIMPDDTEPCFQISNIELPVNISKMITKSLEGKSFRHYKFINNDFGRYGVLAVIDLLDSNMHLQSLMLQKNSIDEEDEGDLCNAIMRHHALSTIYLDGCWEERMFIPSQLIRSNRLVEISMRGNDLIFVSSEERQDFTDALVSNKTLEKLALGIRLNDEGLRCFATILQGNSTLKCLRLEGDHHFTNDASANFGSALRTNTTLQVLSGINGCHDALFDDTDLNSAADSNHTCYASFVNWLKSYNHVDDPIGNRQRKIYSILARRHKQMCNVQYFDDIDINLLPDILAAVQYCAIGGDPLIYNINEKVNSLSITFEIMRKWDKALSLYKTLSDNV